MKLPALLDRYGNPVRRADLGREVAAPTLGSVRSPLSGYPADGLNPLRLAAILREADAGDGIRYLELAETIEERDLHYLGVLGTRRRSVSQIAITVEAASDAADDVARADMVREWLKRDELNDEIFDILDCIGKGISFTEIVWDTSEGQWQPARLEWRDPRWFRFDRANLATPRMLDDAGAEVPMPAFKFIAAGMKAKSGLPLRSGLARVAAWAWMFKAFTQRDWAIFTQTYGQPLRLGKFGPGASEADKETLFRAVANIAGDCAAIIPEAMQIEFVEAKSVGATGQLYRERADWLDQQVSKAVLGQTATTDAIAGGHAVGREHRKVQEDIETADAKALAAILNRDLIRPWMQLEFGPLKAYPRLKIERPAQEDIAALTSALSAMVDRGLEVEQSEVRDRLGFSEPGKGARLMRPAGRSEPRGDVPGEGGGLPGDLNGQRGEFEGGSALPGTDAAPQAEGPPRGKNPGSDTVDALTARMAVEAAPAMADMLGRIEAMVEAAGSLPELAAMLRAGFPDLDGAALAAAIGQALVLAHLTGRAEAEDDADGG